MEKILRLDRKATDLQTTMVNVITKGSSTLRETANKEVDGCLLNLTDSWYWFIVYKIIEDKLHRR